jgi:hypothetical protein
MSRLSKTPAPKPPYKSSIGTWYTDALFYERVRDKTAGERLFEPVFTLIDDKPDYICFRKTFIELNDPTGYKWAQRYLGDYEHWNRLMKCVWFQGAYDKAMQELKIKLRAESLNRITEIRDSAADAQSLVAAKYLAGFEWEKSGRGRPSNKEVTGELKRQAQLLSEEDLDAERIGLKVVK